MAAEIPWETRCAAEDAFIIDGLTYEQASAATGVSVSQVKRWGVEEGWTDKRREYREHLRAIKRDTIRLRAKLIGAALDSLSPQAVYAAARMEQVAVARDKAAGAADSARSAALPADPDAPDINTPADAVAALQQAMELRLAKMAAGEIDLTKIKQVQQSLELIDKLKTKYMGEDGDTTDAEKGLSDADADLIKRKILGIK